MSRAFVKETDSEEDLPERLVSPHPNFVTAEGLALIDGEVARLGGELAATPAEDRAATARINRDLRYWRRRRASAEVIETAGSDGKVRFGSAVTIEREDGRRQTWRIVGEDEADPEKGTLSHVAPLAKALIGKEIGDEVVVAGGVAEIVDIS